MCDVYGNSICTIAALGSGGKDCCYVERNPLSVFPCRLSLAEDSIPVYATSHDWTWDFDKTDKDSHLLQRGWVIQERLLSTRVLYTGYNQFHWECCHSRLNEGYTYAFGTGPIINESPKLMFHALCDTQYCATDAPGLAGQTNMSLDGNMLDLYALWTQLLTEYTHMKLTYQSDKLMALAGIFKSVHKSRGWTHVVGVWKEYWPLELLWHAQVESSKPERKLTLTGLGLPSWSWAATQEPKTFFDVWNLIEIPRAPRRTYGRPHAIDQAKHPNSQTMGSSLKTFATAQLVNLSFCGVVSSLQSSRVTTAPTAILTVNGLVWRGYVEVDPSKRVSPLKPYIMLPKAFSRKKTFKLTWDENLSKNQVVYFLSLVFYDSDSDFEHEEVTHHSLVLVPVPVEDAGNKRYWPPVPWQSNLRREHPGSDLSHLGERVYVGSTSYTMHDILYAGKRFPRKVEPLYYRRVGAFEYNDKYHGSFHDRT